MLGLKVRKKKNKAENENLTEQNPRRSEQVRIGLGMRSRVHNRGEIGRYSSILHTGSCKEWNRA